MDITQLQLPRPAEDAPSSAKWFGCFLLLFKVQFSIALAVIFNLAPNQKPPANENLIDLAELPWRREWQLGESEGKPDEIHMNRREFNRKKDMLIFGARR